MITVWAAITFSFVTVRMIPGGPMDYIAAQIRQRSGGSVSQQRLNQMVELYSQVNPSEPMLEAYINYMISIVQLDFGRSIFYADPVWSVLGPAIPWTMFVSLFALIIGTLLVFLIGGFLAVHEGDTWDVLGSYFVIFSDAVPYYIVGLVLLFTLGFGTEWFPNGGRYDNALTPGFNLEFMGSVLRHAALPIMSFALTSWGGLEFRAHCTRIIGEDYVDVAELRGLSDARIQLRYIGWNSMLPMYTGLMAGLASLFGGSVIMEQIFRYRGMGYYFYEATMARDYTTIMAAVILFTVVTVVGLLIADFTYGFIDPRAGHSQRESFSRSYRERFQRFVNRVTGGGRVEESETIDDRIEDDRASSDGGMSLQVDESDFSRREYFNERFDQSVLTPFRIIWTSPRARVGAIILSIFAFLGVFGPWLVPPVEPMQGEILLQPLEDLSHPLGTDDIGRDLLAQQVLATRPMLIMMLSGAITTLGLAILLGVVAGYLGGLLDKVLMTITDVMMNIPGLALVIVLAVILEPKSPVFVGVILAIDNWPRLARQIRSQVLTLRTEAHVEASRVLGLPTRSILSKNVMSRLMPMLTMGTVGAMRNILMESVGLYFIGVLPFTTSNWGVVLNIARNGGALSGLDRFHWLLAPILFIVTMTYGLQLFAQGTDRLFNPRLRARHAATISVDDETDDDDAGGGGGSDTDGWRSSTAD
ncbi:peptide ABC transporter permease [Candidatus Halobonum tyrrellensis G22]|uniref:Peptide ABC transporter permease n=1 Tax=Candidatus Halobonum tyrrellensis G22 TaxID=1324957 RepID=V4GYC0_9EURY|nr:peptide ABC transporter permease [Candidatus Halobonum tyrrellensis G22]